MSNIIAFSEAASIGLHSMIVIARSNKVINVSEIAEYINSSRHHVAKVLQRLTKDGYISSNRGPAGGFYMKKKPDEVSLLNIYESIEGQFDIDACPGDKDVCPFNECILGDLSKRISFEIISYLSSKTLGDYL